MQKFELTGIQSSLSGNYIPTLSEIYGFNPNDELHYIIKTVSGYWIDNEYPYTEKRKILTKNTYPSGDSLSFSFERTRFNFSGIAIHDTVYNVIHDIDSLPTYTENVVSNAPLEIVKNLDIYTSYTINEEDYNNHLTLTFPEYLLEKNPIDSCFNIPNLVKSTNDIPAGYQKKYLKGLGTLINSYALVDMFAPVYRCGPCEDLVYYNISGSSWGNPVGVNLTDYTENSFKIIPNPSYDELVFLLSGNEKISELSIYSMLGKLIYLRSGIDENSYMFNCKGITEGIYTVKVKDAKGNLFSSKWIKK